MKIERNGMEYKLTADELWAAYSEQQHINDITNIELNLDNNLSDEQIKEVENNSEFLSEAAYALRSNLDDLDMDFDFAVSKAIADTFDDFKTKGDISG